MSEEKSKKVKEPLVSQEFAPYKEYELKYPVKRPGGKTVKKLRIEVPNGLQLLSLEGKDKIYEIVAELVSMCSMDDTFTPNEVLEFKSPDLNGLIEVLGDFLQ